MNIALRKSSPVEECARVIALEEVADPSLRELIAYWETKRAGRDMPLREEIVPTAFPRLMPRMFMIRVEPGPAFIYSLVGNANIEAHGGNYTGMNVRDLDRKSPGYGATVHRLYTSIVEGRRPYAARGSLQFVNRGFCSFTSIYLPLAAADGTVTHILGAAAYEVGTR
ncbi:PAS domain-containing protein [Parvibaculum sp.]|uniref:PAS domain-containing protein n=1 Tax=Parvibaculum sp. TaxID=2024848 RepID=UPI001B078810|nr:PAS domain-containing protein [Parvibaculum sp.]MBO6667277.1 PAS domain-containing protein [Parvibaculum sp.]MBO6691406.1 PAS domain-containing protein [Parvibaculum sp.]MBO6713829.1 PAS domain-containing protein [Parvibaculum sp.]